MQGRHSILQNFRWLAGANIAVKPIWFLFLLISARWLGPAEFGKYMFAISFVSVIAVFFEGGIDILTLRELSARPERFSTILAHTSFIKLISGVFVAFVAVSLTVVVDVNHPATILLIAALVYSVFNTLMVHFRFVFRGLEVMKYEAQSIFLEKLFVISLGTAAMLMRADAETFAVGCAAAYVFACLATLMLVQRHFGLPNIAIDCRYLMREVIRPALPYALMGFFMIVYFRSGTLMLDWITGRKDFVGYYNAGYRLVEGFVLFPAIVVGPLYPTFTRSSLTGESIGRLLFEATRVIGVASMLIALPVFLFRAGVTDILFGEDYADAAFTVGVMALVMIPLSFTWVFGSLVAAVGRQSTANFFIFGATVMNLLLHLVLIPLYGPAGAAVTTVVTEIVISLSCLWIARDCFNVRAIALLVGKLFLPPLVVGILFQFGLWPRSFWLGVTSTIVAFTAGYIALKVVTYEDARKVLRWN